MWADQHDLSGLGTDAAATTVAVQPTTQDQVFNTINLVAQGILNERIAQQNVKMTQAQASAAAEQAKAAATNYVMTSLQKGDTVLISKPAVATPGWASWGSKILVIGGVALLGYVLWQKYGRRIGGSSSAPAASAVASNPFKRGRHKRSVRTEALKVAKRMDRRIYCAQCKRSVAVSPTELVRDWMTYGETNVTGRALKVALRDALDNLQICGSCVNKESRG